MAENEQDVIPSPSDINAQIANAMKDDTLPEFYFNGFINALTQGDILIVLQRNGRNVAKLSASYTVSKTLAQKLAGLIISLEQQSSNTIMTTDDIQTMARREEQK